MRGTFGFDPSRRRVVRIAAAAPVAWLAAGCAGVEGERDVRRLQSFLVRTRDGTRLAADLWLPDAARSARVGTVVELTRYVRSTGPAAPLPENDPNRAKAGRFLDAGLAFLIVDARGTGASFGARGGEQTLEEIADFADLFDWIAAQPWSNGRCGTTGVSYPGGNAELAVRLRHPRHKAAAPMFSYWDVYEHLSMPGGLYSRAFMDSWRDRVAAIDRIDGAICRLGRLGGVDDCAAYEARFPKVKPVDGPEGAALLAAAFREHQGNVGFPGTVDARKLLFRDDADGGVAWRHMSSATWLAELGASGIPYHVRASWMDGGSADGALARFVSLENPQEVYIGATSHGGAFGSDPYTAADAPTDPPLPEQHARLVAFLARHLATGAAPPEREKRLHYVTLNEGVWRSTSVWPPAGGTMERLHLGADGSLAAAASAPAGMRPVVAGPGAATGSVARWDTVGNGGQRVRVDRAPTTALTRFTSAPFATDRRITGHLQLHLELASTRTDGTLIAYLESIDPQGRITYITEGELRLIHRRVARAAPPGRPLRIPRTFARADAEPLTPGERHAVQLDLLPTSVRIAAGHRLALCLADRDSSHFDDYAGSAEATLAVHAGPRCWLDFRVYPAGSSA